MVERYRFIKKPKQGKGIGMKIGIDAHMLGDHSGGNQRFYENILQHMTVPADSTIFLFVKRGTDISIYKDRFKIVYLKSKSSSGRYLWELPRLCRKLKLDILHTQYFIPFIRPCRTICTIHDICFEQNSSWFARKDYIFQKTMIPYAARHSDHIVTDSEYSRQDIIKCYRISPQKISVIYSAADDQFFQADAAKINSTSVRVKYGIGDTPYILSVGNLNPRKNIARLIRAFLMLKKKYGGNEKLVIVGKNDYKADEVLSEASNDIIFTGYVNNEDLTGLYHESRCFVYPSLYEGFGIPPLEAMAGGTPVAVSNRTSLPEVVGEAGLYFDPEDETQIMQSIHSLLTDSVLRETLVRNGYEQAKRFDWKASAEKLTALYEGVNQGSIRGRSPD